MLCIQLSMRESKTANSGFISLEDYKEDIAKIQCRENVNINLLIKDNKITINNSLINDYYNIAFSME